MPYRLAGSPIIKAMFPDVNKLCYFMQMRSCLKKKLSQDELCVLVEKFSFLHLFPVC